jgi:hypothetical protein
MMAYLEVDDDDDDDDDGGEGKVRIYACMYV